MLRHRPVAGPKPRIRRLPVILLIELQIEIQMGQQMCCAADEQKEYTIKKKTAFKRDDSSKAKYQEADLPQLTDPYVEQKKKTLEPYKIKAKVERGKAYPPHLVTGSGVVYKGEWHNGEPHGVGELFFNDGSYFYGTFATGFVHGEGRFISNSRSYYEGQVRHNIAEGKGIYVNDAEDYQYNGEWANDLPNGNGREVWGDGTTYAGKFVNGAKNGEGELKFGVNDSTYKGYFKADEFHGEGELTLPEGTYKGRFNNGKMQGKGVFKFRDGSVYDGEYKNNKKHGSGKYIRDGKIFEGKWENGVRQGEGFITNELGQGSKGYWMRGDGFFV